MRSTDDPLQLEATRERRRHVPRLVACWPSTTLVRRSPKWVHPARPGRNAVVHRSSPERNGGGCSLTFRGRSAGSKFLPSRITTRDLCDARGGPQSAIFSHSKF